MPPRIYADFNNIEKSRAFAGERLYRIDGLGTLQGLLMHRVRLTDGLKLTLYTESDPNEDLEADASIEWDGRYWTAVLGPIRDVPKTTLSLDDIPCFNCRANLAQLKETLYDRAATCPRCATRIWMPFDPP